MKHARSVNLAESNGRRQVFSVAIAGLGGLAIWPSALAANIGCDAIRRLLVRIDQERGSIAMWATSIGPMHRAQLESRIDVLEREIRLLRANFDDLRREQFVRSVNAVGSWIFVFAGVAVSAPGASAGLFAASVFYLQGMLLMEAAVAPRSMTAVEVAQNVTLDRVGGILTMAGDRAYAMSTSVARRLALAGGFVGLTTACFATAQAAQAWRRVSDASTQLDSLERRIREAREALVALRAADALRSFREHCLEALHAEVLPAEQRFCPVGIPRRP